MIHKTILDALLSEFPVRSEIQSIIPDPDDLVHIVGAQEPVRDQPDERSRALFRLGWLEIHKLHITLSILQRQTLIQELQQAARTWLEQSKTSTTPSDRQQVRWMIEKTRPHESPQQITHRLWLAMAIFGQGHRGLSFDAQGRIHWETGITGRIGVSPDELIDSIWEQGHHTVFVASFRGPDGNIARGKGRNRWHIYQLTIAPDCAPLFEHRRERVNEKVSLIVASETHATQPQLPRDFYGGDPFQQACIDAQDQHFDHMLVLSPEHGVISLDDIVPSEKTWDEILEQHIWQWQMKAVNRLARYLFRGQLSTIPTHENFNWWLWLNPESTYTFIVFGGGFSVRVLFDHLLRARTRTPRLWPNIVLDEYRRGYIVGDFDDDFDPGFNLSDNDDNSILEIALQDINQLLDWATEFVSLVTVHIPPTNETWDIAPDEALIPMRLMADAGLDINNLFDLLTDITLLLEEPIPLSLIINPEITVSTLLQLSHNQVHNEHSVVQEILNMLPQNALYHYVEKALQEPQQEDRLCAFLTLAEQVQLINLTIPHQATEQLLVWMQTYISAHIRQQLLGDDQQSS